MFTHPAIAAALVRLHQEELRRQAASARIPALERRIRIRLRLAALLAQDQSAAALSKGERQQSGRAAAYRAESC